MMPAATPPEPRRTRFLVGLPIAFLLLAATVALTLTGGGCSRPPKGVNSDDQAPVDFKGDPWVKAGARLNKDTDTNATRAALAELTSDISHQDGQKSLAMSDEELAALAGIVPLSKEDREEIRGASFSSHDPVYLADCFYLRDAARSLELTGLPPEKQAELAFAWVCRQVYLQPWPRATPHGPEPTVLPPTAVLRRGFGSGLERMYVFLALLQQLELDACFIGGPDAGNEQSRGGIPLNYPFLTRLGFQRGPFWAVGVRVGKDVRLFDPWRGRAFPVTFNELKAKPDAAKAWFEDKANISGATLDDAKKATVYLVVPVNALSTRMAAFESHLKGELGVKVAYDRKALEAMRAAFPDPKPAFWNPPADPFAYGRAARSFLPVEMGGSDPASQSSPRLHSEYVNAQMPTSVFRIPDKSLKESEVADRFRLRAWTRFGVAFIEPPNPRERIQRGQFSRAAQEIVAKQEQFSSGLERLRSPDAAQQIEEWVKQMNEANNAKDRAEINKDADAEKAAISAIDNLWKQPPAQLLIDRASSEVGRAEASLLLALCKHEQAERAQVRLEQAGSSDKQRLKADALAAWKTARSAWLTYLTLSTAHSGFPGRAAHARTLSARAAQCIATDEKMAGK